MTIKGLIIKSWLLVIVLCVTGCGFKLKGELGLPEGIQQLKLLTSQKNAPLHRILNNQLLGYNLQVLDEVSAAQYDANEIDVIVYLQSDELERRLLSLFSTGQVAEYELVYTIRYQLQFPEQDPIPMEFDVTREYQDDPDAVLAKSRELDLIQNEMRKDAANRIIRQIASSYRSWQRTTGG